MKVGLCFAAVVAVLLAGGAAAYSPAFVPLERDVAVHPADAYGYVEHGPADPATPIMLTVAVRQNEAGKRELERTLLDVSDPRSPNYGKHLDHNQVNRMVAPSPGSLARVTSYLLSHGADVEVVSPNGDWVTATTTVGVASRMLNTEYSVYRQVGSDKDIVRCSRASNGYHVPAELSEDVDFVGPTVRFPRKIESGVPRINGRRERFSMRTAMMKERRGESGSNALFVTPGFLRSLYNATNVTGSFRPDSIVGVASFLEQYYSPRDLQIFYALLAKPLEGHKLIQYGNASDGNDPGIEAELDVQYLSSVAQGVQTAAFYTPGRAPDNPQNEPFVTFFMNLTTFTSNDLPKVISASYGDGEKSVSLGYATRLNVEMQKLGSMGVSIMFASGDDGVGGNCTSTGRFSPDYPSSSPWCTVVGGVTGGKPGQMPTGEFTDLISGGGFSDYFGRPSYQDAAVTNYFSVAKNLPKPANYNATGRGYPDVAAQSEMFDVVVLGIAAPDVSGTSCACPTFSGLVGLLNDQRIAAGKSTLGFLNPLLYSNAGAGGSFNDITVGGNGGCDRIYGFMSSQGWDPATGWGSMNFGAFSEVTNALP